MAAPSDGDGFAGSRGLTAGLGQEREPRPAEPAPAEPWPAEPRPAQTRPARNKQALIGSLGPAGELPAGKPVIHSQAWIAPGAIVVGAVSIGRSSSVWYGTVLRADDDEIHIGDRCNIQDLCCIHVDSGEPAVLGDEVSVGHHATVHGAMVGAGALIGMGAVVLGGASVGAGSLVAAGTVVLPGTTVPACVLFAGVPGRVVRDLTEADRERIAHTSASYVNRARRHQEASWYQHPSEAPWPG
ncbi:MAG TPA: gamma carbonic anhydrase family protein [Streptosporangiaceae bacterium]|nr:gamma carbonic anhydrase family protein [Streptosporangiaceae bacterium]